MKTITLKTLIAISLFLFIASDLMSQSHDFIKTFGGAYNDEGHDIIELPDGGFLLTGAYGSLGDTLFAVYVLRLDSTGKMIWQQAFEGPQEAGGNEITVLPNGNFFIGGHTESRGVGDCDAFLFVMNPAGDTLCSSTYGGPGDDAAYGTTVAPDGNYFSVGIIVTANNEEQGFLLKTNSKGDTLLSKQYGGPETDFLTQIRPTPDGNFLVAGLTTTNGNADFWLMKLDPQGNVIWSKSYGTPDYDEAYGLRVAPDGGCLMVGKAENLIDSTASLYLNRTDQNGNVTWSKIIPDAFGCSANSAVWTADSSWIICGEAYNAANKSLDAFLMKTDDKGNILWTKYFGGPQEDNARRLSLCRNGDIIFTGFTKSSGNGEEDVYVVRTSANGEVVASIPEINYSDFLSVQPNPFNNSSVVRFTSNLTSGRIVVYDLAGKLIKTYDNIESGMVTLSKNELPSGVYVLQLNNNDRTLQTRRIVVE